MNPLQMRPPVDETRLSRLESALILDAIRTRTSRFGLEPADLGDPQSGALYRFLLRPDLDLDDAIQRAADYLVDTKAIPNPITARAEVSDVVRLAEDRELRDNEMRGNLSPDVVLQDWANTLRVSRAAREAQALEDEARAAAEAEPSEETRRAYAEAMLATNSARRTAPSRVRSVADIVRSCAERRIESQGLPAIGLQTPTYPMLSSALFGWRGLVFLAAKPGIGKTTLATAAMFDALRKHEDACGVFVSFEMPVETLVDRTLSQMSEIPQRILRVGDLKATAERTEGLYLTPSKVAELRKSERILLDLGDRLRLVGKHDVGRVGGPETADDPRGVLAKVEQIVLDAKRRSGASRSFVVIDHFGCVPLDPTGDRWADSTERDKRLIEGLCTLRDRLDGDRNPVVVVAQARKADYEDAGLASIMGTADSGFAADAVIVFNRETFPNTKEGRAAAEQLEEKERKTGHAEITATIAKGRDMMVRRDVKMRLHVHTSRLSEVQ